jgi:DDE family transposase
MGSTSLIALDMKLFERALTRWAEADRRQPPPHRPALWEAVALDGKSARGSSDGLAKAVHLLSLMAHESGLTLAQTVVPDGAEDKTNEHKTALRLLDGVALRGRVVTGDALFCQRDLSQQILDAGGHFLWFVKENQPTLFNDIEAAFAPPVDGAFSPSAAADLGGGDGDRDDPRQGARAVRTPDADGDDGVERLSGLARRRAGGSGRECGVAGR